MFYQVVNIKITLLVAGLVLVVATATFATSVHPLYAPGITTITTLSISSPEDIKSVVNLVGQVNYQFGMKGVWGAIVSFTGTGVKPDLHVTANKGGVFAIQYPAPPSPGTYTIQAHFAGRADYSPSDSPIRIFTVR
jgi:hypothetical protein